MWILFTLLAVLCWTFVNVLDSILVRHYEDRPLVISWVQATMSVPMILVSAFFLPVATPWAFLLLVLGILGIMGDFLFWRILKISDVSSSNFVGAFLAIIVTAIGYLFFRETLTVLQAMGALSVILGVAYLSFSAHRSFDWSALLLMAIAASLYAPFYVIQKLMLLDGQTFFSTFFWMMLGREVTALSIASFFPVPRRQILASVPRQPFVFFGINFVSIALFLVAMFGISRAYALGTAFHVSVLANIQPFVVITLAWIATRIAPRFAPRELLTAHSLRAKLVSFSLVFLGLALLGVSY